MRNPGEAEKGGLHRGKNKANEKGGGTHRPKGGKESWGIEDFLGCWCPFRFWLLSLRRPTNTCFLVFCGILSFFLTESPYLFRLQEVSFHSDSNTCPHSKNSPKALTNAGLLCTVMPMIALDLVSVRSKTHTCSPPKQGKHCSGHHI